MNNLLSKFENAIITLSEPVKPFLPWIARFLLVVTYLEDSLRMTTQFQGQVNYFRHDRGFPLFLAQLFVIVNVIVMLTGSILAISRKYTPYAVLGLFSVIFAQGIAYHLLFDYHFFFRNISLIGGLIMLLADYYNASKKKTIFAGIPSLSESDKSTYLQLTGRILLVFLFLTFVTTGEFTLIRVIVSLISFVGCIMVVVGFKAKYSAWFLIAFLSISNFVLNNWWSLHQ